MSEIKTTKEFHDSVVHAQSFEELRATCLRAGETQGVLARDKDGGIELRATTTAPDKRNANGEFERIVYANGQYLSLTAKTPEQLDVLENIVRKR